MDFSVSDDPVFPVTDDLRIVLLGKTGSGKSATGNTILGLDAFRACFSPSSVTKRSQKEIGHFNDRTVSVIDTPGIFDTLMSEAWLKSEIVNCIKLSAPGPHVFLLVIRLDARFTTEEKNAVKWIKDNFGEDASKHTLVLFTKGDILEESIDTYISRSPELSGVLNDFNNRYVVFDNTRRINLTQVADLFEKIDEIVYLNRGYYTISIYDKAQKEIRYREWWTKCRNVGSHLVTAATAVAVVNAPAVLMAENTAAAAGSITPYVVTAAAGFSNFLGKWMTWK